MAVPPYWNTGFKKSAVASFADVADWIVAIRTMLTATLDVADRWVESPAGTFTSPADAISGNKIVIVLARLTALRMALTGSQIVGGVTTALGTPGEADITGAGTATIMAGPKHFWTESNLAAGEYVGIVLADPAPESPSGFSIAVVAKSTKNQAAGGLVANADVWQGIADALPTAGDKRVNGPCFIAAQNSQELRTAGGSWVFFPCAATTWPTTTASRFIGNLNQFVWVDQTFAPGSLVTVPIDVGVVGVFQVVSAAVTAASSGRGGRLAVRVA